MSVRYQIGVIGGGQLARMMAEPAIGLGIDLHLLAEQPQMSATSAIAKVSVGDYQNIDTLRRFADSVQAITFDHEHVPTALLRSLEKEGVIVRPGSDALQYAQDKLLMRQHMTNSLQVPSPKWRHCQTVQELVEFGNEIGWPIIAKASRGGYDGHGVWKLASPDQAQLPFEQALKESAGEKVAIIGEEFVDFSRELSLIVARSPSGQAVAYPISETKQENGVCVQTITPAPNLPAQLAEHVTRIGLDIADEISVVGILAIELLQRRDGEILLNELAMRPHNTGHWTIDGAYTSQFENHLRAVCDLPLGDPRCRSKWTVMTNILGGSMADLQPGLVHVFSRDPNARVQLYGKKVTPGRKVGHVTCYGDDLTDVKARSNHAANYLMGKLGS